MQDITQPTLEELSRFLLDTVKHVCSVEYFINALEVDVKDKERPHDIAGVGNKFFWPVMRGMAMHYRKDRNRIFDEYIRPAIEVHRLQHHHRMWNTPNGTATNADLRVGAIDTVCSLLENRIYQGGSHSYEDIISGRIEIADDAKHKKKWMSELASQMILIRQPEITRITSLYDIPNIGLPVKMYNEIIRRVDGAMDNVDAMYGRKTLQVQLAR